MFNKKVLLIEDDPSAKNELELILKRRFKHVFSASDGLGGLEIFKKESPELVVTDIRMPKMNGAELCKVIKDINPSQYVIAISAYSDSSYLVDLINAGVNRFVTKPINPKQLLNILENEAENIDNRTMLKEYQDKLEIKNEELKNSNTNLTKSLKIFENKMKQLSTMMHFCEKPSESEQKQEKTDAELEKEQESLRYFIQEHNSEMVELEAELDAAIVQMDIKKSIDRTNAQKVAAYLYKSQALSESTADLGWGF